MADTDTRPTSREEAEAAGEPRGLYDTPPVTPTENVHIPSNSPRARELSGGSSIVPTGDKAEDARRTAEAARVARAAASAHPQDVDIAIAAQTAENEKLRSDEASGDTGDGYDGLTKAELQARLTERDLSTSGNREELVARLRESDATE